MQLGSTVYTPVSGTGAYSYQFRIVDIYNNYVDQYVNFSVNAVAVDPPSTVTATTTGTTFVTLSWSGAAAQDGIASYNVYRGGTYLGNSTTATFTDSTTTASTTYSYTVVTVDTLGNDSPASLPLILTTSADFEVFTPIP
jgi:fibronectin type 3 domain-containing protein